MNSILRLSLLGLALSCQPRAQAPASAAPSPATADKNTAGTAVAGAPVLDRNLARPSTIAVSPALPGFARGINLGNGLDAPSEGAWGTKLTDKHFEMAANAGFDHVRLPVRFSTPERADTSPPYTVQEAFFQRVDWAIEQALARKLSVIVDFHHYEEIHKDPRAHQQRFYGIWRQIAARYANRPPSVAFEILNEPNGALEPKLLNELTAEALRIIREKNPTRIVFADSYFWGSAERLAELALPSADANVIAQFHMYQPILFTHQAAPWMTPEFQTRGVIFPGPPSSPLELSPSTASHGWVKDWFERYNRLPAAENPSGPLPVFEHFDLAARYVQANTKRVYLGEFGVIDVADEQSRENYLWLVRTEAERRGIGWAYWDDGGRFKLMDTQTGRLDERLRRALFDH
jgi:endoglucanase